MDEKELYQTKIYRGTNNGSCPCCGCGSNVGPAGPMGPMGPRGPIGPIGPAGPEGRAGQPAASQNAMLYDAAAQTVAPGGTLAMTNSIINSTGAINAAPNGVTLMPGQYLINFSTDASITEAGALGAALALDGMQLPYATSNVTKPNPADGRIALNAVLTTAMPHVLTVENPTAGNETYANSTLTVTKLM